MPTPPNWTRITPATLDALPDDPGVFEIANLVRTVQFIGAAPAGLADAIREALRHPRLQSRSHCIRFEKRSDPEARAEELLDAYRRRHGGLPPHAHRTDPLGRLLERAIPPGRAVALPRSDRKSRGPTMRRFSRSA